mmetsp:Transcript_47658/g.149363  ORF Transcript_47658/g.149363 Transcript_47658/m.149363 type:complete len:99 (-) Transcript_47658:112-408(-)
MRLLRLGIRTYFNGARRIYGRAKSSRCDCHVNGALMTRARDRSSMHNDKSYFFNPLIFESQSLVDVERERCWISPPTVLYDDEASSYRSVILKLAKAK